MGFSVLAQRRMAAHNMTVEFKRTVGQEAPGPALCILSVNRVAVTGAQLLNSKLFDPFISHRRRPSF
jgi:hypothetical protein